LGEMVGKKSSNQYIKFIKEHKDKFLLFLVFLIGIVLRGLFINSREIAYDDAFSYFLSRQQISLIISGTASDTMPPLYYLLLHYWMKISTNLWFLRLLNILINFISAGFVYKLAKEFFNTKVGILATFFFLLSPFQIYHSQELRMYSLLLFGQLGFYYSVLKIILFQSNKPILWGIFAVIFGVIVMYSHNLGFIGLISINLVLIIQRNKEAIKQLFFIQGLVFLFSLPWFYFLPQQISKVQLAFWTQKPGILEIIQSLLELFSFLPQPLFNIAFVMIILLQSLFFLIYYLIKQKDSQNFVILLFSFAPPVLLFLLSYLVRPVFVPRIFIYSSVWIFILLAFMITKHWHSTIGKINFLLFTSISLISLPYFYQFNTFPRSQFKNLTNLLQTLDSDTTPIIHDNKLSFFPSMFYYETNNQYYLQDIPGSPNDTLDIETQDAIGYRALEDIDEFIDNEKIFFIVFQEAIDEYQDQDIVHPVMKNLEKIYGEDYQKYIVGDIILYSFGSSK
jgi:uncharacterized membrane protein